MELEAFRHRYGPVAVVTGASSGIGRAFAEWLADRVLDVVLVARRVDRLRELAAGFEQVHGVHARVLELDLAQPDAPQRLLAATADLDVGLVVSNAGFGYKGRYEAAEPVLLTEMLMVNCHAPIQLARAPRRDALRGMARQLEAILAR